MSISISCPTCGKAYNLNESLVGKNVRCKHCADTFPVELDSVLPTGDAATKRESHAHSFSASGGGVEVHRAADDELLDVEAVVPAKKPQQREPVKQGSFPWLWCLLGGGACLLLLVCGGIGVGIYLIIYNVTQAVNNVAANVNNMNPAFGPQTVPEAVADLQSREMWRQQRAAQWLAQTPSNPADQPRVAQALEALLNDPFVKGDAANALVVWGGPGNVPALIRCVETNDFNTSDAALKALVKIRDPRAVPPIAKLLNIWGRRDTAANALRSLGPMCETEVLKYAFDPDNATHDQAQQLLKGYGTSFDTYLPQVRADLKHVNPTRRLNAVNWLAQRPVVEARRAEVAAALNPVLSDKDNNVRNGAVRAAKVWATKENVPALIKYVNDRLADLQVPEETWIAMEVLVGFKDERAYWPIAQYCENFFHGQQGRKYLAMIGAAAEPEVARHLTDRDAKTRKQAWVALSVVGAKTNLANYQAMAGREMDFTVKNEANNAVKVIMSRR